MTPTSSDRARLLWRALRTFGYRAWSSTFEENAEAARELVRAASRDALAEPGPFPLTIVLLCYRRAFNTALQAHLALSVPGVTRVLVSHNDPSRPLPRLPADPRLSVVRQPRESGPITRYQVLCDEPGPWFLAIDDDLFLSPRQALALVRELVARPEVPHGLHGQHYRRGAFEDNVTRASGEVDVLNRAYAFSAEHLRRYFELLERLGITREEELRRLDDDIVLSFAGSGRPLVHELGPVLDCPSEARRGALWRRRDALRRRTELFEKLAGVAARTAGPSAVGRPLVPGPRRLWLAAPALLARRAGMYARQP